MLKARVWSLKFNYVTIVLSILFVLAKANALPVLPYDDIPWKFHTQSRIVAVGDVHGDLEALRFILKQNGLIDASGVWIAGKDHLVLNGDLVNQGQQTFEVLQFIMQLEKQAEAFGGKIHCILGNHEIMLARGKFQFMSQHDQVKFAFEEAPQQEFKKENLFKAFSGNSKYAAWMRTKNSIVQINNLIFAHAGLGKWALDTDIGQINATVRQWIRKYNALLSPDQVLAQNFLPSDTEWVVSPGKGPMWTSAIADERNDFAPASEKLTSVELDFILQRLDATAIVTGHIMTHDHQISMNHTQYGARVIQTDTGISLAHEGDLSALVISESGRANVWHALRPRFCSGMFSR